MGDLDGWRMNQQSPFIQTAPVVIPAVLKPLVYCEFRIETREYSDVEVTLCATFACVVIHKMSFCMAHSAQIEEALRGETQ